MDACVIPSAAAPASTPRPRVARLRRFGFGFGLNPYRISLFPILGNPYFLTDLKLDRHFKDKMHPKKCFFFFLVILILTILGF